MKLWTVSKRIILFVLTNIMIIAGVTAVLSLLNVGLYLSERGIDYRSLLIFATVWGFGGAFVSLAMSRMMAKWMLGVQVISPQSRDPESQALVAAVHELSRAAGLTKMPEVGVYESEEVNAFATGPTRNRALVAVSSGLLKRMEPRAVAGVLAHEVAHVANGDMVTMTLVQGVINVFVMFFARIAAWALGQLVDEEKRGVVHFAATIILEIALGMLGLIVVSWFSRVREFKADAGGAKLAGTDAMLAALRSLKKLSRHGEEEEDSAPALAAFRISGRRQGTLAMLFATHPPLEERIARLEENYGR